MSRDTTAEKTPWWRGERGEWYVVVQGALFALIAFGPRTWPGAPAWSENAIAASRWLGAALMISGVPLAAVALRSLGKSLTALPYPTDDGELVTTGPYAIVRHPIYSGLILGAFGWGLWLHSGLVLLYATALFVLFDLKSRKEERWLVERYPDYAEYRTRVKKLLPWVW